MAKFLIRRPKQLTKSNFKVEPDPAHPYGGYARILRSGGFAQHEVHVEVLNQYSNEHLGENGWQPTKHRFGPYRVDTGKQGIVVGPEIVGHLQANALYKLTIERFSEQLHWPDSINPPPFMLGGGRISRPDPPKPSGNGPIGQPSGGGRNGFPGTNGDAPTPTPAPSPEPIARKSSRVSIVLALALFAAAISLFFFLTDREPVEEVLETPPAEISDQLEPEPVTEPEEPEETEPAPEPEPIESEPVIEPEEHAETEPAPQPTPAPDPCGKSALLDQSVPFEQRFAAVKGCPVGTEDDVILELLHEGVEKKNVEAIIICGDLYNGDREDPIFEGVFGLSNGDNLMQAARYYDEGADTGDPKAKELEDLTCRRLLGKTDEASQWAVTVYCED